MFRARPRFDVIPDPPAPGWPALYKTVREADVNKVEDCREDIDTLLVFAGLYSAVLTAFVIESYTHLQQDPQDVIIGLLERIATQNFVSGPGFINSTAPPPPPAPFEPPLWAIRVNVLWFTSLLLSLASASFGILVKQWLREYLAIEYTVPQQRLRARQYRYPALAQWKVFEIAAFLPLLLQLSLGLFFVGLCFFTAAVHSSVGRTTTPLVSAWAFLLLVTTIAPLFSPRCPFKTTFLKRSLTGGRRYIGVYHASLFIAALGSCLTPPCLRARRPIRRAISKGFMLIGKAASASLDALRAVPDLFRRAQWSINDIRSPWVRYPARGLFYLVSLPHRLWKKMTTEILRVELIARMGMNRPTPRVEDIWLMQMGRVQQIEYVQRMGRSMIMVFMERVGPIEPTAEEKQEVVKEGEDENILLSVDSLMCDDGLLPSMLDAVQQQAGTDSTKLVGFIARLIAQRNGHSLDDNRLITLSGPRPLSRFAYSVLADATAHALTQCGPGPLTVDLKTRNLFHNSVIILRPSATHQLSDQAINLLHEVFILPTREPDHSCFREIPLSPFLKLAVDAGLRASTGTSDPHICLRCVMDVYRTLLCGEAHHSHPSLRHLLDAHDSEDSFVASSKGLLQDLFDVFKSFLVGPTSLRRDLAEIPGSHEAFHIILQYGKKFDKGNDAVQLCRQMLLTESGTRMTVAQFAALRPQCRVSRDSQEILRRVHSMTSWEEDRQIWSQITSACERFCSDTDDDVPLDYVRLCAAFVQLTDDAADQALARAVEKYHRTQGWRKELRRREYWYSDAESPTSEELFEDDQRLACELLKWWYMDAELKDALWLFVPEEHREGILCSIHERRPDYTPRTRTAAGPEPGDLGDRSDETSGETSVQEVGEVIQEALGIVSDTGGGDTVLPEAGGGTEESQAMEQQVEASERSETNGDNGVGTDVASDDDARGEPAVPEVRWPSV